MRATQRSSEELPALGEVLEFMRVVWQLDHALQRASKRMEVTIGVTGPQRLVLRIVGRFPGISAGQLAKLLHIHPSTLTGILKRLERQGLLRRHSDPRDGRRSLLGLTAAGRKLESHDQGTIEACVSHALEHLPAARVSATREVLNEVALRLSVFLDLPVGNLRDLRPARGRKSARATARRSRKPAR